jgi:chromosome segregation ATPase
MHVVIQEKLGRLREDHSRSNASSEMLASKLERTTLQLDGAQTKNSELERINEELKRTNNEIQRQLVKWQNLETKGDLEVETLLKRRLELEGEVKDLETRIEKNTELSTAALEKERRRVEKFKTGVVEWQVLHVVDLNSQTIEALTYTSGRSSSVCS